MRSLSLWTPLVRLPLALAWLSFTLLTAVSGAPDGLTNLEKLDTSGPLCMGHALLCDRPYNQITLAATHVSHAVRKNEKAIGTQDKDIPTQLKDGIRGFFLEVHPSPTEAASAQLCFISCTVNDGGTLGQTLQVLANFLANNPRELVTIVLDNPGGVETAAITKDFVAAGLDTLSATGPALGDWQTAGQLLDAGKQAVIIAQANVKAPPAWMVGYETHTTYSTLVVPAGDKWPMGRVNWKEGKIPFFINYHMRWENATVEGSVEPVPYAAVADITNGWDLNSHIVDLRNNNFMWPHIIATHFYNQGMLFETTLSFNSLPIPNRVVSQFYPKTNSKRTEAVTSSATSSFRVHSLSSQVMTGLALTILSLAAYRI